MIVINKKIKNYENYLIDTEGKVYNLTTKKFLKGSIGENGYKYYRLSKENNKKMFYAHRLVAEYFIDNPNNLPVVNHIDGNKLNNNINNLEWVSHSENSKHAHSLINRKENSKRKYYNENLVNERWKQIYDFPYSVSNLGRVKNDRTDLLLQPSIVCGYYKVTLSVQNVQKDFMIHNLVYYIFNNIDKNSQYVVDHIDGNKLNNKLNNLRLVSLSENVKAALYETKMNHSLKAIEYYKENKYLGSFPSIREAARQLNLDASTISKVCQGKNKSHGGYTFKYKTSTTILKEPSRDNK